MENALRQIGANVRKDLKEKCAKFHYVNQNAKMVDSAEKIMYALVKMGTWGIDVSKVFSVSRSHRSFRPKGDTLHTAHPYLVLMI